jgi:hypothetical protein
MDPNAYLNDSKDFYTKTVCVDVCPTGVSDSNKKLKDVRVSCLKNSSAPTDCLDYTAYNTTKLYRFCIPE